MQNDEEIRTTIINMKEQINIFIDYTAHLNQCAYTDRIVERILEHADQLKKAYDNNTVD